VSLTFDEPSHTYRWHGVRVPNVTSILAPLLDYSRVQADALERARQEGTAIHKMVELDCAGDLDTASLPEWMLPVYRAWQQFREASGFVPILNEYQGFHPTLKYAGTLDIVCEVPKFTGWKGLVLLDVKRSLFAGPVIGAQLAAYDAILHADKAMPQPRRRGALRLSVGGKFQLEPFDDPTDFSAFIALLTLKRWRERHSI